MPAAESSDDHEVMRRLRQLGAQWHEQAQDTIRQLDELTLLLRQAATEVDRLGPRSNQATQRLRDMEAHLESYSRADMKELYAASQEAHMRLFMMQLQREQLEYKQRVLSVQRELLDQVIQLAADIPEDDDGIGEPQLASAQPVVSAQESLARIIHVQEDERRNVSRQIHDGPAQSLANIVLRAEICERLLAKDPAHAGQELTGLKRLVTESLREIRHLIFDLRPMILDDLGLIPTLRRYCDMLSESSGVPVRLSVFGGERRLGSAIEVAVFRMVQEAVRNSLRHGDPGEVEVTLEVETYALHATVRDDGRGCDGTVVLDAARQRLAGGLAHLDEYVRSLDGALTVESEPARGCRVSVSVPLTQPV